MTARVLIVVVALPVIAWLGLSHAEAGSVDATHRLLERPKVSPAETDAALRDLDGAERLNPSRGDLQALRFALDVRAGRLDDARTAIEKLVRDEPENAEAWLILASLTRESDPARSAQARARLRELDPQPQR